MIFPCQERVDRTGRGQGRAAGGATPHQLGWGEAQSHRDHDGGHAEDGRGGQQHKTKQRILFPKVLSLLLFGLNLN